MASTIDTSTKVQLGLLITLLCTVAGGSWWAASMSEKVLAVKDNSDRMTASTLRIEEQLRGVSTMQALHAKDIESIRKDQDAHNRRLEALESKTAR